MQTKIWRNALGWLLSAVLVVALGCSSAPELPDSDTEANPPDPAADVEVPPP